MTIKSKQVVIVFDVPDGMSSGLLVDYLRDLIHEESSEAQKELTDNVIDINILLKV